MATRNDSWRGGGTGRGAYTLVAGTTSQVPLTIQLAAGATANGFLIENSAGTDLFSVDPSGNITIAGSVSAVINETLTGNISLTGTLSVTGTSTLTGNVTTGAALFVGTNATFGGVTSAPAMHLRLRTAAPAAVGSNGILYTANGDTDTTELWYKDAAGNEVQITDAGSIGGSSMHLDDDEYLTFGATSGTPDVRLGWNTAQTVDGLFLGLSDGQNTFIIAENGDRAFDFAHGAATNPTLFIHSAAQSTTQWLSLYHNQTDSFISSGAGDLNLIAATNADVSVRMQNQIFTPGANHEAVIISPQWSTANFEFSALLIQNQQNGANSGNNHGLHIQMVKATGATTLAQMSHIHLAAPNVTGTVTASFVIDIEDQTNANITTPRGIRTASGVANAYVIGNSPLLYSSGAQVLNFYDSTAAAGITMTLTAAGNQTIATSTGDLLLNIAGGNLAPSANDGFALGTSTLGVADIFLATGSVINWVNGDITLTHAAGKLTFGGDGAVEIDFANNEMTNVDIDSGAIDGTTIGATSATTGVFTTIAGSTAGNVLTLTNSTDSASVQVGIIQGDRATVADGDEAYLTFRLSDSAGNQDEGARITWKATTVLTGATQDTDLIFSALVNNTLTTMLTLDGSASYIVPAVGINAAGITSPDLGTVTTIDINGGSIDGTIIGAASAAALTATTGTFSSTVGINGAAAGASALSIKGVAGTTNSSLIVLRSENSNGAFDITQDVGVAGNTVLRMYNSAGAQGLQLSSLPQANTYFLNSPVLIGSATAYGRLGQLFEINTSANYGGQAITTWAADNTYAGILELNKSGSNTIGTHTIVENGEKLGFINWRGSGGGSFVDAASIYAEVDGTPGVADMPTRLVLATTADGASTYTERMRIDSAGRVSIGSFGVTTVDFHIRKTNTGAATTMIIANSDEGNTTTQTARIQFSPDTRQENGAAIVVGKEQATWGGATTDSFIAFHTDLANSQTERLRVTGAGVITTGAATPTNVTTANTFIGGGGFAVGDVLASWIDDATHGAGSTAMFIGNQTITVSSDVRLKTNIVDTKVNALDLLSQLRVVDYNWNEKFGGHVAYNKRGTFTGLIAQEAVGIIPTVFNTQGGANCSACTVGLECSEHIAWNVEYDHLVPTIVKGVQELHAEIAELKKEVAELKAR